MAEALERIERLERVLLRDAARIEALEAALRLAEEVLSQAPYSTQIWPNGMHPQRGITIIRAALAPE